MVIIDMLNELGFESDIVSGGRGHKVCCVVCVCVLRHATLWKLRAGTSNNRSIEIEMCVFWTHGFFVGEMLLEMIQIYDSSSITQILLSQWPTFKLLGITNLV